MAEDGDQRLHGSDLARPDGEGLSEIDDFHIANGAGVPGHANKLSSFVEEDLVYMKVTSLGSYSYDTQAGGSTTVPLFGVKSIWRKGSCE